MASEPFLAQISIFSFSYAPRGWAQCNGQLLPINQNQPLFSLLGTMYGGDGRTNFALPNLQGRVPLHIGSGFVQGQSAGEQSHTVTLAEMPTHTHQVQASSGSPNINTPQNNFWAGNTGAKPYNSAANQSMSAVAISTIGGSQPHENMSPYLVLNICIALIGVFPSRN